MNKTPEQLIDEITETLQKAAGKLHTLEKSHTFAEDWPTLERIHNYIVEAHEELDEYNVKWREDLDV